MRTDKLKCGGEAGAWGGDNSTNKQTSRIVGGHSGKGVGAAALALISHFIGGQQLAPNMPAPYCKEMGEELNLVH